MDQQLVMVVDDEEEISQMLARFLKGQGFSVSVAHSLSSAHSILTTQYPLLVFLDINLPDGNGLLELPRLQTLAPASNFIIMSAMATAQQVKKYGNKQVLGFLHKPFSLNAIRDMLEKLPSK